MSPGLLYVPTLNSAVGVIGAGAVGVVEEAVASLRNQESNKRNIVTPFTEGAGLS